MDAALEAMHTGMDAGFCGVYHKNHTSESLEHLASDNEEVCINITCYTLIGLIWHVLTPEP